MSNDVKYEDKNYSIFVNNQSNFLEDKFNLSRGIRLCLYILAV